jgi:hypothetical protein
MKATIYFLFFLALATSISCRKLIDVNKNPNQIETTAVFQNDQIAISAIGGLYAQLRSSGFTIGSTLYLGLAADEIINTASSLTADPFKTNSLLANNGIVLGSFWTPAYQNIYRANAIIEGLNASTSLTDSLKKQLEGEALVVRAFLYFYLVNLFGDVPLIATTNYAVNATVPRTQSNEVYDRIINDLTQAKVKLKAFYSGLNRGRINRWAASTLLARVYLYMGLSAQAESEATEVIASNSYSLEPSPNTVFLNSSKETIWQLISDNGNTPDGSTFIPSSATARPPYVLTTSLLGSFEANDKRRSNWVDSNKVGNPTVVYYYPKKYKARTATPIVEYPIVFRLAELFLIRAEARNNQGKNSAAQSDLNIIRTRAGLPNTPATTQEALSKAIAQERRIELFEEWGQRWLDLKRTKQLASVLQIEKGANWQSTDSLFPIPESQLLLNVNLNQNPGY